MSDQEKATIIREARRPRFDGTVNLGHVLTATAMLLGGFVVWMQSQIVVARQDARLTYVEAAMSEVKSSVKQVVDNQQLALRTQDKLATTLDLIAKRP